MLKALNYPTHPSLSPCESIEEKVMPRRVKFRGAIRYLVCLVDFSRVIPNKRNCRRKRRNGKKGRENITKRELNNNPRYWLDDTWNQRSKWWWSLGVAVGLWKWSSTTPTFLNKPRHIKWRRFLFSQVHHTDPSCLLVVSYDEDRSNLWKYNFIVLAGLVYGSYSDSTRSSKKNNNNLGNVEWKAFLFSTTRFMLVFCVASIINWRRTL